MNFRDLEAFLAVATELNFHKAAQLLHTTQPTLSRTIKRLESNLDTVLFYRDTGSVELSESGHALLAPVEKLLRDGNKLKQMAAQADDGVLGDVTIGFSGPSSYDTVRIIGQALREECPKLKITLDSSVHSAEGINQLQTGELDLALVRWTIRPLFLNYWNVSASNRVLVVSDDHPMANRTHATFDEFLSEKFITFPADPPSPSRTALFKAFEESGRSPNIVQTTFDSWTAITLAAAGVGVTFTLDTIVNAVMHRGVSSILLSDQPVEYARLAWLATNTRPAVLRALEVLKHHLPIMELHPSVNEEVS